MSKKRFSKVSLLESLWAKVEALEKVHRFVRRQNGWAQAAGNEMRMMAYGQYDALLTVIEELSE